MRDLIVFAGEAASGKDYILNQCLEEFGWRKVISHTTRPIRDGEIDGRDYHFISDTEFFKYEENRALIETTSYKTTDTVWHYGFHKDSIKGDGIKCMIMNPHGIKQLIDNGYGDRMIIVRVRAYTDERVERYFNRLGDNPTEHQLAEGFLRLKRDIEDFREFDEEVRLGIGNFNKYYWYYRGVLVTSFDNDSFSFFIDEMEYLKEFVEDVNGE